MHSTDAQTDKAAHDVAAREAADCDVPDDVNEDSFRRGVYAFAYITARARLAQAMSEQ